MNSDTDVLARRIARARQGDQEAITDLVNGWTPHVLKVIRARLGRRFQAEIDAEDVAQEVWLRFVRVILSDARLASPDQLLRYLLVTARRQAAAKRRSLSCGKRDSRRVGPMAGIEVLDPNPCNAEGWQAGEELAAMDSLRHAFRQAPVAEWNVVCLLVTGASRGLAAQELQTSVKTIERLLQRFRGRLFA
jgi:DNA-directed RNA polymerase specialized sigma24 family protein